MLSQAVQKFGENTAVGTGAYENVWIPAALYTFLSSAGTMYMASTDDTNDKDLEITIEGLDANWVEQTIVENLDATASRTPVLVGSSAITWIRVNRAYVSGDTAITGNVNIAREDAGTWSGGAPGTATNIKAYIPAPHQQTMQTVYSTPADTTHRLWTWYASERSGNVTDFSLQIRSFGKVFRTRSTKVLDNFVDNREWRFPIRVFQKSDIMVMVQAQASPSSVVSEFELSRD
jgi:hypothetical protein